MPWTENKDFGDSYKQPAYGDIGVDEVEYAIQRKKYYAQEREKLLLLQKEFGPTDREFAKHLKEVAAENLKMYRGYCHVIAIIAAEPPGDCKLGCMTKELAPYADRAFGEIDYRL